MDKDRNQLAEEARAMYEEILTLQDVTLTYKFRKLMDEMFALIKSPAEKKLIDIAVTYENTDHDQSKLEGQILKAAYDLHGERRWDSLMAFMQRDAEIFGHNNVPD